MTGPPLKTLTLPSRREDGTIVIIPKRSRKPRLPDPNKVAFGIIQRISGETPPAQPAEPSPTDGKNPAAVALGRLG
jgi:hypothetical protein